MKLAPGTIVRVGNERAVLIDYSSDGRRFAIRRFRGGRLVKAVAWYEGTPRVWSKDA